MKLLKSKLWCILVRHGHWVKERRRSQYHLNEKFFGTLSMTRLNSETSMFERRKNEERQISYDLDVLLFIKNKRPESVGKSVGEWDW